MPAFMCVWIRKNCCSRKKQNCPKLWHHRVKDENEATGSSIKNAKNLSPPNTRTEHG
jgi:hypothetical protein